MRKAQLVQEKLVLIILLLISFFVLLSVVYLIITRSHAASVSKTCELSLAGASRLADFNINCRPSIYTVQQSEIKEDETVSMDKIKGLLAKEMAACWKTVSKGEFGPKLFGTGIECPPDGPGHHETGGLCEDRAAATEKRFCLICTVLEFDEETSGQVKVVTDFSNYLKETEDIILRQKYHDYMQDHYTASDQIDITGQIAVVWLYKTSGAGESSILLAKYDGLAGTCDIMVN